MYQQRAQISILLSRLLQGSLPSNLAALSKLPAGAACTQLAQACSS